MSKYTTWAARLVEEHAEELRRAKLSSAELAREDARVAAELQDAEDRACAAVEAMHSQRPIGEAYRMDPATGERVDTWEEARREWLASEMRAEWLARRGCPSTIGVSG